MVSEPTYYQTKKTPAVVMISASSGDSSIPYQWYSFDRMQPVRLYQDFLSLNELGTLTFIKGAIRLRGRRKELKLHLNHAAAALLARFFIGKGPRYVLTLHRDYNSETMRNRLFLRILTRLGISWLVSNSSNTQNSVPVSLLRRQSCMVIYNGVDEQTLNGVRGCNPSRVLTDLNRKAPISAVFVGRLISIKNPLGAILLVEEIAMKFPIKLQIIGDGTLKQSLASYIDKNKLQVTIVGKLAHRETLQQIAAADVVLIPSLSEGYCNVAAEAMFLGKKIIYNNIPTLIEVIGRNGLPINFEAPDIIAVEAYLERGGARRPISSVHTFGAALASYRELFT